MTADEEFEVALAATQRFADAWQTRTTAYADSAKPQALHVARVPDGEHVALTEPQLRAVLDGLERLRAARSCGSSIPTESGRKVCVLPFGHDGPKHRDADGVWWEIHISPAAPDDAAVALIRQQALAAPNWYATPQRSEPGGAL